MEDTAAKAQESADMLRRRRGRASAILSTGSQTAVTAAKQLLGG